MTEPGGPRGHGTMDGVTAKHRPTPEERDERIKLDLPPEEFIEGVLAAGPHEDDDDPPSERGESHP